MFGNGETRQVVGRPSGDEELIDAADDLHAMASRLQREMFRLLAEIDRRDAWRGSGAQDMAHWVSMRYGVSSWKAHRWVAAASALEALPAIARAFEEGELGIDKIVELTRFATPEREAGLVRWAREVSSGAIRNRGDLEARRERRETLLAERERRLSWWYVDDGKRFGLEAELPADQGAIIAKALGRLADSLPVTPEHDDAQGSEVRRADALVGLCSAQLASDPDHDRATLVVHASLETLAGADRNAEIEDGPVIAADTARRIACNARIQVVVEDQQGEALRLGRLSRDPSAAMMRQLRHRDRGCRFPGCGRRRFTQAHHVVWWSRGGRTDLDNLVLTCSFHHRLVHEHRWAITRDTDGSIGWARADGTRYRAGPSPGIVIGPDRSLLAAVG